ncbi:hypothetical protein ACFLXE_07765 [Chloroflexota bacterium]
MGFALFSPVLLSMPFWMRFVRGEPKWVYGLVIVGVLAIWAVTYWWFESIRLRQESNE